MSFLRDRLRWMTAAVVGLLVGCLLHSAWLAFAAAAAIALALSVLAFAARVAERVDAGDDELSR